LLARDAADLGHADENGNRSWQPNAVDAEDEIEPLGEIIVLADVGDHLLELDPQYCLETADFLTPVAPETFIPAGLTPRLEAGNVLGDLLDEGRMLGKGRQARVGRGMDFCGDRRASCDQASVDLVVLSVRLASCRIL
jgi:hypothetical protein